MKDLTEIIEIAAELGWEYELVGNESNSDNGQPDLPVKERRARLTVQVPMARKKQPVTFHTGSWESWAFPRSNARKFRLVEDYDAIWSRDLGIVECRAREASRRPPYYGLHSVAAALEVPRPKNSYGRPPPDFEVPVCTLGEKINVTLGIGSPEYAVFCRRRLGLPRDPGDLANGRMFVTLRIQGVEVESHADALRILNSIGAAALFELDAMHRVGYFLARREFDSHYRYSSRRKRTEIGRRPALACKFDRQATELYWYGRSAGPMPLLQYLAYYQVIEYFFGHYARFQSLSELRIVLKQPGFDAHRERDLLRAYQAVEKSLAGGHGAAERRLLEQTLVNTVPIDMVREYLSSDDELKAFFTTRAKKAMWSRITDAPLNLESDSLLKEIAQRIYAIRCRIVHTKAEHEVDLLLPFSEEARNLGPDIMLIEKLAQQVLISSASRMTL